MRSRHEEAFRSAIFPPGFRIAGVPLARRPGYNPAREAIALQTLTLLDAARSLPRLHVERDDIRVDDANRAAHRELAAAGLMIAAHSFRDGREPFYRFTDAGWAFATATWPSGSAAPRR